MTWQSGDLGASAAPRSLPGHLGIAPAATAEPVTASTSLDAAASDHIRQAAGADGPDTAAFVAAAWALLRARYGGVTDVILAVRSGDVAGAPASTVPLRVRIQDERPVRELLTAVNDGIRRGRAEIGPASAGLSTETARAECLLVLGRDEPGPDQVAADSPARTASRAPSYPLTLRVSGEAQISLSLTWDRPGFVDGSPQRMLDQLRATLTELAGKLATRLADLDLLSPAEAGILAGWNRDRGGYPAGATIPALFAAQVARDPQATALVYGSVTMTYAELDRRSNALAWMLRRRGVSTDTPVAVAMNRGVGLITALLGVLKAGGAYVPVDTGGPLSRVAAMTAAAGTRLVLAAADTAAAVRGLPGMDVVRVDAQLPSAADEARALPIASHPLSLAYVSFTSGSTGVPKGVAVPHRAVIRLISDPTFVSLGPGERLLHLAPVAFDASTFEIWGALLTGATLVVAPPGPLGLSDIASLLQAGGVTVAWLTTGLFRELADADIAALTGVRALLTGGEVMNPDTVRAVLGARRGRGLVHAYGPTENTTFTTCYVMTDPGQAGPAVPIGGPIQHTSVYILDERGRQLPIGVPGELYAGGDGLARGYAGNAAATARAFVPDPAGHGTRLYRTGDLARWRADGTVEFLGRRDEQVKIRGFRVEPGEVEVVLRAYPGVQDALVLATGEGTQRHLVGYVTSADGADPAELRPSLLRDFTAARLPEYMVPVGFKILSRFPLKANGKVDRAALPAPELAERGPAARPRGATEDRLAELWRSLLRADGSDPGAGREDSFFAIGGNSLLAARLTFRIHEVFGVELSMASFYEAPTLAATAAAIDIAVNSRADGRRQAGPVMAGAPRQAAAPSGIGRRDRSSYRVAGGRPVPDLTVADSPQEG